MALFVAVCLDIKNGLERRMSVREAHLAAHPDHEPGEDRLTGPEGKATRPGIGDVRQGAELDAGRRPRGVHVQGTTIRQGRISTLWKRSTAVYGSLAR